MALSKEKAFEFKIEDGRVYAGVLDATQKQPGFYIGGPYYDGSAQIHITWEDAMDLAKYFNRCKRTWKPNRKRK